MLGVSCSTFTNFCYSLIFVTLEPRTTNLPCQTKYFLGRDAVVNEIKDKLLSGSSHVVILVALPGMGKTEVAIRVGHLLQSGSWPVFFIEKQENLLELCELVAGQQVIISFCMPGGNSWS